MFDVDTYRIEIADRADDHRGAEARARGRFYRCPECGSIDGMEHWTAEQIAAAEGATATPTLYCHPLTGEQYAPCPTCNRAGVIPDDVRAEAVTAAVSADVSAEGATPAQEFQM